MSSIKPPSNLPKLDANRQAKVYLEGLSKDADEEPPIKRPVSSLLPMEKERSSPQPCPAAFARLNKRYDYSVEIKG